jgi:hypothetical protein
MKLYLSSYHLGNKPEKLKELVGENAKAAIILKQQTTLILIDVHHM